MKSVILLIIILKVSITYSQDINFCNYFTLKVNEVEYNGKKTKACSPQIIYFKKDRFSKFARKHNLRFDYIIFKHALKFNKIAENYPDTIKIHQTFCDSIINQKNTQYYLGSLTPKSLLKRTISKDTFSMKEIMLVASKFFYCDKINRKDTSIQSHICIGINGQNEFKSERDLTVIEAYCYEVIFHYLIKKNDPKFYTEFYKFKGALIKEKKSEFVDFDSHLLLIRKLCYSEMENNVDLENKLKEYYNKNRNNLNFTIKNKKHK